ncbi:MAG: PPC domain-containing DNA-binding protein [Gemmatimonadota bacterium]
MKHLSTHFREVVFLRLQHGEDILACLQRFVAEQGIDNALFLNAFGSVTHYHFHVVASGQLPPAEAYPKGEKALDIVAMSGAVLKGRVHAHITFTDDRVALGGHLEPGCRVLTFAMITLGILDSDADLSSWDTWKGDV